MEKPNVFIDKKEIDSLFNQEKYKNCMDKKYFEYIVSSGKIDYIDKHLKSSKNKQIVESLVLKNKVVKVIDKLSVKVENGRYIGELENLEIDNIEVSEEIVNEHHNQILTNGIFALITLEENIDKKYKYYIEEIEVLEDTNVNLDDYRGYFSSVVKKDRENKIYSTLLDIEEQSANFIDRIEFVLNTIGISTEELTFWEKILFLIRLIPLCESNYNLMELGGNGIGKTKTYTMFSPECEIVQEMLVTEIIYNRQSKMPGLLKTKDVIVFDEINKLRFDGDKEKIIPSLLNFMADGQTTSPRKVISKTSFVFSGNVMGIQERIEKNEKNIFDNSHKLEDSAFLDRIHFFLPAWGLRRYSKNIHGLEISKKVFRFDYFSKVLSLLREEDYSSILDKSDYEIRNGSEREVRAIRKTVSGLIKLTHPDKNIDEITLEAYIAIAIKGRGLVNRFLNNKNKNNVNKIDIKVMKREYTFGDKWEETKVNESLKKLINLSHSNKGNEYFDVYEEYINKNFSFNSFKRERVTSNSKFYPNRQIVVFDNEENKGELVFIKIALDKIGIIKNKREEKIMKKYKEGSGVYLKNNGRILIFVDRGRPFSRDLNSNSEKSMDFLFGKEELNYDGLFGDKSLDENDFTGTSREEGTRNLEADLSNIYFIDKEKKLKCEDGEYITPNFRYSRGLNKYFYEDSEELIKDKKTLEKMTYVEFKYFLAENEFIKLNE